MTLIPLRWWLVKSASVLLFCLTFAGGSAHAGDVLGKVDFANSCSPAVQAKFQRGVAMLHSFYYSAAQRAFEEVAAEDQQCAVAAWGYATILMQNPLGGTGPSPKEAERAQLAIEKGRAMNAKTERERDYLEATAAYYQDWANHSERERQLARAKAYEVLAAKYPDDDEAQIFSAVYTGATQQLSDKTYAAYLKCTGILEKQFVKHPDHPGVAHYLIHCYDAPSIAAQGLPAARRYAAIAPDAPHALHMPSHIFTRVGAWSDSIATNRRSATVAINGGEPGEALHAMDYMTYADLQLARDKDAAAALAEARAVVLPPEDKRIVGAYPRATMPARYAVERGAWDEAAKLPVVADKVFPVAEANTHFARALGAARSGDPAAAAADIQRITELRDQLRAAKSDYWAGEVEVMRLTSVAWVALADKHGDEALATMRQAADLEDKSEKHIVTPARILPARELLGDMLMELHRPADALKEYEASQQREPNRLRGLYGSAMAASDAGDKVKAKAYFARLIDNAGGGDPRPETAQARAWLAAN